MDANKKTHIWDDVAARGHARFSRNPFLYQVGCGDGGTPSPPLPTSPWSRWRRARGSSNWSQPRVLSGPSEGPARPPHMRGRDQTVAWAASLAPGKETVTRVGLLSQDPNSDWPLSPRRAGNWTPALSPVLRKRPWSALGHQEVTPCLLHELVSGGLGNQEGRGASPSLAPSDRTRNLRLLKRRGFYSFTLLT